MGAIVSVAYVAGGVAPINRLRAAVRDTGTTPSFDDAEYSAWLEQSRSLEYLAIYHAQDAGMTAATAEVKLSADSPPKLILELKRVGLDASVDTIVLAATATGPDAGTGGETVGDIIERIRALNKGWKIGIGRGAWLVSAWLPHTGSTGVYGEWLELTLDTWRASLVSDILRDVVTKARAADLALTRQGTLNAMGDDESFARLHFYYYATALGRALESVEALLGTNAPFASRTDARRSWTRAGGYRGAQTRLDRVNQQAAFGLYAEIA